MTNSDAPPIPARLQAYYENAKGRAGKFGSPEIELIECIAAKVAALRLAQPVLSEQLQSLCESYCPSCQEGEIYDYSELKQPELGWITQTEAALDAVDAALKGEE